MSLFGSSPTESSAAKPSSLFDDQPTSGAAASQSSLFADDGNVNASSPWALPTPKKSSRSDLVKTLLPASDTVPESYIDIYDGMLTSGYKSGTGVSLTGVSKVLEASGLGPDIQSSILNLILPRGAESSAGVGRNEFNVLLALIGLAQENEEATLDGVDERRANLPKPSLNLPSTENATSNQTRPRIGVDGEDALDVDKPSTTGSTPARLRAKRDDSMAFEEADPWASPALHRGHNHADEPRPDRKANGHQTPKAETQPSHGKTGTSRTSNVAHTESSHNSARREPLARADSGWQPEDSSNVPPFSPQQRPSVGSVEFGPSDRPAEPREHSSSLTRPIGGNRALGRGVDEIVVVTLLPEKEGLFMFQHRNYQVSSARRGSKVTRRYSDFLWLLECLQKRYPFRQLPLLPPKRVAVNGNHFLSDTSFLEKRRRGLARFTNALVRHPVLSQEQLVVMFLTVPTELAVWRKQATISVQDEFSGKTLPPDLEDSLPSSLSDTFDVVRSGVRRSAEVYMNLCGLLERLARRNEGMAADYMRLSLALQSLSEASESTYAVDTSEVPSLNAGLKATARHLSASQSLLEDEAKAWDDGVLEDLKTQRDNLVSIRDMFDRRDRYAKDNIPSLERRIQNNETKLAELRGRAEGSVKPGEIEKVEGAIIKDKQSIVEQHARGVFIKECIRDELIFFQTSQYHVSRLHQDWSQERVKYAELQADNWRSLSEEVEGMPSGE